MKIWTLFTWIYFSFFSSSSSRKKERNCCLNLKAEEGKFWNLQKAHHWVKICWKWNAFFFFCPKNLQSDLSLFFFYALKLKKQETMNFQISRIKFFESNKAWDKNLFFLKSRSMGTSILCLRENSLEFPKSYDIKNPLP